MVDTEREFEIIVWGATGFTGRLVAEHLSENYGTHQSLRWALGGRDHEKLQRLAGELNVRSGQLPIVIGDSHDRVHLDEIVRRTSVVCSTVGPYVAIPHPILQIFRNWCHFPAPY
jgi:short subunit dehydrogenase-like uncharacterized protein